MSTDRTARPRDAAGRLVARVRGLLADGWHPTFSPSGLRWARPRPAEGREDQQDLTPADGMALDALAIIDADTGHGWPHSHLLAGQSYHHRHRGGHLRHTHLFEEPPA